MMSKKQSSIHFKGNEDFISRIEDYLVQVETYHKVFTPFLNLVEQDIIRRFIGKKYFVVFDGGYDNSEYKRCMISYGNERIPFPITCLKATYSMQYNTINHRDVLGALMHLGLKRNQIGDIIVNEGNIYIFVNQDIASFIIQELQKIKHCSLTFETCEETIVFSPQLEYQNHVVSSFRLDVLVSAITKLSRDKAKQLINDGRIKVNQIPLEDCAYLCHNNCILSIRGYGRFKVENLDKLTRKNRHCVRVGKYT